MLDMGAVLQPDRALEYLSARQQSPFSAPPALSRQPANARFRAGRRPRGNRGGSLPKKFLIVVAVLVLLAALAAAPGALAAAPAGAIVDGPDDPQGTVILVHASGWQGRYDDPYYH